MKLRESKNLPPEMLYDILAKIYPKSVAQVTYLELTGKQPPESAEDAEGLHGLEPIKEEEA
mgnify:CR=1 FL=1